ncbi:MAG TPA: asparagine synthase-related protein [Nocardioides sp.]|nr:asparagine synthase-related protein [Nocardioides sp.]
MKLGEDRGVRRTDRRTPGRRPSPSTPDPFLRPGPLEVAAGWVYGHTPATPLPVTRVSPRAALDDVIRPALVSGPCYVTFSGGRDSSAVLAAATALARREGHAPPVPVTRVYPDIPATDESDWQRAVIEHLGLTEWIRLELREGESDLLGPAARAALARRGVLWPPALQSHGVVFDHLRGGHLLTGEGGDAVLGARRVTPVAGLRQRRRPDRRLLAYSAQSVLPRVARRTFARRLARTSVQHRWLRPAAFERHVRLLTADATAEPLGYCAATWSITHQRSFVTIRHNHTVAAAEYGVRASDPLLDPRFVAALAHAGGRLGFPGRTATMQALFSDVLPSTVLHRSSKASFNRAHAGAATREFARGWDGSGVDEALVDADRLRAVWLSDTPTMATGVLLHQAWLADAGLAP